MKAEDELDAEIGKMLDEVTKNAPGGKEKKRVISDAETIAEMDFEETQAAFLVAEKKFRHLSEHPNVVTDPKINYRWWCALEELYQCDKKLWLLFVGQDRSVRSNMMYKTTRSGWSRERASTAPTPDQSAAAALNTPGLEAIICY